MRLEWPPAIFSTNRKYRYVLYRSWDHTLPRIAFIGLNPSKADENINDPTVRRCINFAKKWGYGSLLVGNIFALKSTDPNELYGAKDPVGPFNDTWLDKIFNDADTTVACWGTHGNLNKRGQDVRFLLYGGQGSIGVRYLHVFGFTKHGFPKHPLYLNGKTKIDTWEAKRD